MKKASFSEALQDLLKRDTRYTEPAYFFVREGLDHTIKQLAKPAEGPARHVTGRELSEGLRALAIKEYGPMARTVLAHWGVRATQDFTEIGAYNPNARSIIPYNTDSDIQPTVRSNGVLIAQVVPSGGVISASSSVVQLDA